MNLTKDKPFPASILDQNGQILDTGTALLSSDLLQKTYYQSSSFSLDNKDKIPTLLYAIGGQKVRIQNFRQCECQNCRNYHFDL